MRRRCFLVAGDDAGRRRAELTFAMARHACVDLCLVFWLPPIEPPRERLTEAEAQTVAFQDGRRSTGE